MTKLGSQGWAVGSPAPALPPPCCSLNPQQQRHPGASSLPTLQSKSCTASVEAEHAHRDPESHQPSKALLQLSDIQEEHHESFTSSHQPSALLAALAVPLHTEPIHKSGTVLPTQAQWLPLGAPTIPATCMLDPRSSSLLVQPAPGL